MSEQTILLVDDDPEIVKTVLRYLLHEGYAVQVAHNGVDALDFVREQPPDCIVLDVMLPDHNGWEITERISVEHGLSQKHRELHPPRQQGLHVVRSRRRPRHVRWPSPHLNQASPSTRPC